MKIMEYLTQAVGEGASDIYLVAGAMPSMRVDGRMMRCGERLQPEETAMLVRDLYLMAGRNRSRFEQENDDDFSFSLPDQSRFRVNVYKQRGSECMVIRVIPFGVPSPEQMHIPDEVMGLARLESGMVLVTGTAGSGKSTTQACILDAINQKREAHIVTLEDPIEYLHRNVESIVSQREVGLDTKTYLTGLKACLRESPDVILLGEMRDPETIQTALTAAETGHLVIATLHTKGAVNAVDRIIDAFPSSQQAQVRLQVSMVVDTVVSQVLVPGANGHRVPVFDILKFNTAVRNLVRDGKTHQLGQAMSSGAQDGMVTAGMYAERLLEQGLATRKALEAFLGSDGEDRAESARQFTQRRWSRH